ncbi:MAG: S8 family serine peptidase [Lachnospiraceae bacterium]|nr:S8 family serine peptidase [Lachnospiraceae bacterium]
MNDQKLENQLNLAINATEEERIRSGNLNVGYDANDRTWEVIIKYTKTLDEVRRIAESVTELFGGFAIVRIKENALERLTQIPQVTYVEKPKAFYFALQEGKEASCMTEVQSGVDGLSGKGVLFACVDSGVSYTHPDFCKEDGSTRILYLWDQTIPGNPPKGYFRGTEYTKAQIDTALAANTVSEREQIVPSKDISGHGTSVLGIGAGNGRASGGRFRGVAYEADLIVVKLGAPGGDSFPRTTEIMEGVDYCIRKAVELSLPVAVNLSFGNNYGAHDGSSLLENYLNTAAGVGKTVICTGMGNEGVSAVHQALTLTEGNDIEVEFTVGEFETSTNLQLWKSYSDKMRIYIEEPGGASVGPIEETLGTQRFFFENAELLIYYGTPTPYQVQQEVSIEFLPVKNESYLPRGVWKLRIEPIEIVWNLANLWLPVSENTRTGFLTPTAAGTFTVPAPAVNVISVAAYDSAISAYADFSGRAFQVLPWNGKPDLAAPGVDITVPAAGGGYGRVSGTSFATPFVTGSAALLMEWGIVRGNDPFLFGNKVKAYLRRGARPLPGFTEVPNYEIGYGTLCLKASIPGKY